MGNKVFTLNEIADIRAIAKRVYKDKGHYPELIELPSGKSVRYSEYRLLMPKDKQHD